MKLKIVTGKYFLKRNISASIMVRKYVSYLCFLFVLLSSHFVFSQQLYNSFSVPSQNEIIGKPEKKIDLKELIKQYQYIFINEMNGTFTIFFCDDLGWKINDKKNAFLEMDFPVFKEQFSPFFYGKENFITEVRSSNSIEKCNFNNPGYILGVILK